MAEAEQRDLKPRQIVMLVGIFLLMCVVRLWFALFLLFAFAIVLTLTTGRKKYCADYCPLGGIQDYYPPRSHPRATTPPFVRALRWPVFILFWGYLAYQLVTSFGDPTALWQSMLLLIIIAMVTSIILQSTLHRRAWCSRVCPLGTVLNGAVKVNRGVRRTRRRMFEHS